MNSRLPTLLIVLFIGVSTSYAQRCKYELDEMDPITDDIIRTIKNRITGPITGVSPYYYFYYMRSGSDHTIKVEVADYGELTHSIPEKSELILRLEDGGLIRIFSKKEAPPKKIVDITQVLTEYIVQYEISEEEMKKIAVSGIVFMRGTDFKNTFSDQKIPKPITQQSRFNAECIFK